MSLLRFISRSDTLAAFLLLVLPLFIFASVTLGSNTLLPVDNLFAYEPWLTYRAELGVGLPQNQLLSDLIVENYVWKSFIRDSFTAGQLPLWNPYILAGQPFLANGQHSAYYPFTALFYLLPLANAYGWFTVSQLWLAGLSMYFFLRALRASRLAALIAGMTYALSSFFMVSVVFTMIIAAAVWLPALLAIIEIIIRKQQDKGAVSYSPIPYIVAGAAIIGLQTLAGHVEMTYYTLLVAGFYTACRLGQMKFQISNFKFQIWLPLAIWLIIMVGLGVSLGGVQLVPMVEVVSQNFRDNSASLQQVREWALPWRRVITFIIPDFFGSPAHHATFDIISRQWQPLGLNAHGEINPLCPHCTSWDTKTAVEASSYIGILPLVLAFLAIAQATRRKGQFYPIIFIFTLLAALSLLFAFGTPLYGLLFYLLPGWNQLHSPFRWIFPYTLSMAVLAGLGAHYLQQFVSSKWGVDEAEIQRVAATPVPRIMQAEMNRYQRWLILRQKNPHNFTLGAPSFIGSISYYLGWLLFWSGLAGALVMLSMLIWPSPFISIADVVFARSGLAQNAFANGQQFLGYEWPHLFRFFLMVIATGAVMRITRCPIFLRLPRNSRIPSWQPAMVIVIALDLIMAGYGFNPSISPKLLEFKPPVVAWLEQQQAHDPYFRLTSFDTPDGRGNKVFLANMGMASRLFDVRGYDSIIPAQYGRFMQLIQPNGDLLFNRIGPLYYDGYNALDSGLLDLLGVRYILTTVEIPNPNYRLVYDQEIKVYENLDTLPRAFIVPTATDLTGASWETLSLALRNLNPRETVILDGESNDALSTIPTNIPISPTLSAKSTPSAVLTEYTPNQVRLTTELAQSGWLVLADSYFNGWRAYLKPQHSTATDPRDDEHEITLYRANGNFRAVQLPPGQWEVRFRYSPRSFQFGLYASFIALVSLVFLSGYWTWGQIYHEEIGDSAIKRIAKNSLVPMLIALSNRLIDFTFALLTLRILQPEGAGRYAFAIAVISMTEIITRYGLGTLVTREVAAHRDQGNRYLANVTLLRLFMWLTAIPLMTALLATYVVFGNLTMDVVLTIGLLMIGTLFSNFSDGLSAVYYAHEKAEYPAGISSITTLTRVSVGALMLLLGWGIMGLAFSSIVANLVAFSLLSIILTRKIFRPHYERDGQLQWSMMAESLPLMLNNLLATIFFRIDVFILSPMWGDNAVGYYNAAYKYIDGINVIPQYFTLAIFPLMSRYATNSRESLARAYILSLRLLLLIAIPLAIGTPFVAETLIRFLAGERFLPDSTIVLQLLIWFLPFSFVNQVTQYVLIAINQQRALTRAFIMGVLFNLITNLMFIPFYGYRAAAITTIMSEWVLLIPFYWLVRDNLCEVPWFDIIWRPSVAAAVMGLSLWFIGSTSFLMIVVMGGAIYGITLLLIGGLTQTDMPVLWRATPLGRWLG